MLKEHPDCLVDDFLCRYRQAFAIDHPGPQRELIERATHDDFSPGGDEQHLIWLLNRMRVFAPANVVSGAEAVLRAIVEVALKPSVEPRQLAKEALSSSPVPDPLLAFSEICRTDLDRVARSAP
jgi:hypothetical protein